MIAGFFGHAALTPSTYAQYAVGASVGLRRALHQFSLRDGLLCERGRRPPPYNRFGWDYS